MYAEGCSCGGAALSNILCIQETEGKYMVIPDPLFSEASGKFSQRKLFRQLHPLSTKLLTSLPRRPGLDSAWRFLPFVFVLTAYKLHSTLAF